MLMNMLTASPKSYMLKTVLHHYLLDTGINLFFENIIRNFNVPKVGNFNVPKVGHYLNKHWIAHDEQGGMVAFGLCVQDEGDLIVLDNEFGEFIVSVNLFCVTPLSEKDCDILNDKIDAGEMEFVEYDETLINWLEQAD